MACNPSIPNSDFPYPPLPSDSDAIRILTVEPAKCFSDPLIGSLHAVTFEIKPKYVALSYTWRDPYPDNAKLPTLPLATTSGHASERLASILPKGLSGTSPDPGASNEPRALALNGRPYLLGHNLHLALLHLRSRTAPLTLWVDAVCIDQGDLEERNAQVALMSLIFMRAMKVVAWLGTRDHGKLHDPFQSMSVDWSAGKAARLADALAGATGIGSSRPPDRNTLARVAESSYWTRIWVVQEVCLPRLLVFVYGANIWAYEDLQRSEAWKTASFQSSHPDSAPGYGMRDGFRFMLQLFHTRDTKHSDTMRLESLLERFSASECTELRDRVYGLLGLAKNITPINKAHDRVDQLQKDDNSLDAEWTSLSGTQYGRGSIIVDYSRSYYDMWADVFISTCMHDGGDEMVRYHPGIATSELYDCGDSLLGDELYAGTVRTAGIIQEALDQMVDSSKVSPTLVHASLALC